MFSSNLSDPVELDCSKFGHFLSQIVVESIELHNFKSYAGIHSLAIIDKSFTAIGGSNGLGKSNLIDALLFCLGCDVTRLRVHSARELIHSSFYSSPECASVRLNFR